jgi:hypothetical protein
MMRTFYVEAGKVGLATLFVVYLIIIFTSFSIPLPQIPPGYFDQSSPIEHFEVLAEVSIVVNLTVSALIAFGKLAGDRVRAWSDQDMLRVIPPLSENATFNQAKFIVDLEQVERDALKLISEANSIIAFVAALAIFVAVLFSAAAAFFPDATVTNIKLVGFFVLVLVPVPIGFLVHIVIRGVAYGAMYLKSHECRGLVQYTNQASATKIAEVTADLAERRRKLRNGA